MIKPPWGNLEKRDLYKALALASFLLVTMLVLSAVTFGLMSIWPYWFTFIGIVIIIASKFTVLKENPDDD